MPTKNFIEDEYCQLVNDGFVCNTTNNEELTDEKCLECQQSRLIELLETFEKNFKKITEK